MVKSCNPYLWFVAKFTSSIVIVQNFMINKICNVGLWCIVINISVYYHKINVSKIQYSILHAKVVVLFLWRVIIIASFRILMNNLC